MDMIICPNCEGLADYNTFFDRYFCRKCDWRSDQQGLRGKPLDERAKREEEFMGKNSSARDHKNDKSDNKAGLDEEGCSECEYKRIATDLTYKKRFLGATEIKAPDAVRSFCNALELAEYKAIGKPEELVKPVRCKECSYSYSKREGAQSFCCHETMGHGRLTNPNHYCSYGELRGTTNETSYS